MAKTIKEMFASLNTQIKDIWNNKKNRPISLKEFTSVSCFFYNKGANDVIEEIQNIIALQPNEPICRFIAENIKKLKT